MAVLKNLIYASFAKDILARLYQLRKGKPWSFGYSFYKYGYIRDTILQQLGVFNAAQLPKNYGQGLDERAVEYPWFFARLKPNDKRILDAGSSLNHYDLLNLPLWKDRLLHITTLADEGKPYTSIKPVYVYEDLRQMSYPNEFFDAVVCISTLEHVGMDNTMLYTDDEAKKENNGEAYLEAVVEMRRVLKDNGSFFLTMPYGQYRNLGWFQVFNQEMVKKVIKRFAPAKSVITYYKYSANGWQVSSEGECAQGYYVDIHSQARYNDDSPAASQCVVCIEMVK